MKTEKKRKSRYRHVDGKPWIEVRVRDPQQLFDIRDPAPFRERDLDDDFVEYIVSSAREFPLSTIFKVIIYIEAQAPTSLAREAIQEAIRSHFIYLMELQTRELRQFMKRAQLSLLVGIVVLVACLAAAFSLPATTGPAPLRILREGLVIFGWVTIWKPIELLLFDWYPLFEKLKLYRKLAATEFDVKLSS